ncbi:MAG: chemotaxis protein CheR [Rhodospirillaceae bacterium]|jgi:chemotaxis protein methyltransferase CheR|nr:chemotaxis protein CheR [Rhodospirillaceae bacterium]|tara:strand:- start:142 stop:1011 length:870 start_codon:yes stop_codon:yes gene_type:complete
MTPDDFNFLRELLKRESGLVVSEEKSYLLESRLIPVARKNSLDGLEELVRQARNGVNQDLVKEITEAMTTNESFFFRDIKPFDIFRDATLPYYMDARIDARKLRIWCAAASSGQEPYSLAMILSELGAMVSGWNIEILGTDISTGILEKAEEGLYSQFEVQRGLPVQFLVKYFEKEDEVWRIKNDIRSMVKYRKFNLLDDLKSLGRFDIVFCRNVLIYFDQETKTKILAEIAELMPDDGLLFLGGAETVLGISDLFRPIPKLRGVYEVARNGAGESAFLAHSAVAAFTE